MFLLSMEYFFSRGTLISIRPENWIWVAVSTLTRQATDSIVSWWQGILQYAELRFIGKPIEVCFTVEQPWRRRRSWIRPWLRASVFSCSTLKVLDVIQGCVISRYAQSQSFLRPRSPRTVSAMMTQHHDHQGVQAHQINSLHSYCIDGKARCHCLG